MSDTFNPMPEVPEELRDAASSGELVLFIGAGISRLVGLPSWDEFADYVLRQLVPAGIDYYQLDQIRSIRDPKRKLSIARIIAKNRRLTIDYRAQFDRKEGAISVYSHLNRFKCTFVTTNYDKRISPDCRKSDPESSWRFFRRNDLIRQNLDVQGNVIHLHGCIDEPNTMIMTDRDYLEHYSQAEVRELLTYMFNKKVVLFLGYGLDETEILEYIFRRGSVSANTNQARVRRFILQGFFNAQKALFGVLSSYYSEVYGTELIGFPTDYKWYDEQEHILERWAEKLDFGRLALTDEADLLEEEVNG